MNAESVHSNTECLRTPVVRQRVLLSRWVNEPFPPWDQILTAHEVARLARRPPWFVSGMAAVGRFPRKRRFRDRGIGWLRSDALSWLAQDHRKHDLRSVSADGAATPEEARDRIGHASVETTSGTTFEGLPERNRGAEYSTLTRYSTLGNFWRVQVIDYWRARRDSNSRPPGS